MVLRIQAVETVVNVSANLCQYIACNPQRLSSDEVLDLLFCFPFQHFRRFTLCIWTFFCFPAGDPFSSPFSASDDDEDRTEDPHSD